MKHLKLFEGFYSDRIQQVLNELKDHMREDLIDWVNVFSDELNHPVKMVDPYISISAQDGEEHIVCSICIDFRKTRPNDKELNFIFNTFSHIRNTLKGDYKIEGVWEDIFGREYDSINPRNMMENIDRRGIKEM